MSALALGAGLSFLYIANIAYWWADGSPPSRYLLGGIPLLVAAVAGGWEVALSAAGRAGTALRALAWGSVVASAAVTFVYAMQPNTRYDLALDVRASGSTGALWSFLDGRIGLDPGVWFPSMVSPTALAWALAVAWLAAAGALVWTGTRARA